MATHQQWHTEAQTLISAGMGVRETARKLGLPEERVKKWATRAGICKRIAAAVAIVRESSPNVPSAAQVLTDTLVSDGQAVRTNGMRYARLTTAHAAKSAEADPEAALERAPLVKAALQAAGIAGDWSAASNAPRLSLNLYGVSGEMKPVVDI